MQLYVIEIMGEKIKNINQTTLSVCTVCVKDNCQGKQC